MTGWVTDKRFLVGLAVGWLLLPRVAKVVQMQVANMRGTAV